MDELIKRLEQASGPSIELDEDIRVTVGDESINHGAGEGLMTTDDCYGPPAYTASIDTALTLVPDGLYWMVGLGKVREPEPLGGVCIFRPGEDSPIAEAEAPTVPTAICIAALRARRALTSA